MHLALSDSAHTKPLPENDRLLTNVLLLLLRLGADGVARSMFWRCAMRTIYVLLLTVCATGCGYNSKNSGSMASPAPSIMQLMPPSTMAGGPTFMLTVNGSNFATGAAVYWNGNTRTTMFVSSAQVVATIQASDIASAGTVPVYVRNPGGTGIYSNQPGQNSNTMNFIVNP